MPTRLEQIISAKCSESGLEVNPMRVFWERVGILALVYRLVGRGFSDREIATKLNRTELDVQGCTVDSAFSSA
jgi:hypothetical protein